VFLLVFSPVTPMVVSTVVRVTLIIIFIGRVVVIVGVDIIVRGCC
jgi:hypothetical protein